MLRIGLNIGQALPPTTAYKTPLLPIQANLGV